MPSPPPEEEIEEHYNLGPYSRSLTCRTEAAQTYFTRGLIWTYAFNHEAAAANFSLAIASDPECAMAYWGLALCLGPNYNRPWEAFDSEERETVVVRARQAVAKARECATPRWCTPAERALCRALGVRYEDGEAGGEAKYAEAMGEVYREFGSDLDVAALYADALMNLTPWALWDMRTGEPAKGARTLEIKSVLETALARPGGDRNPGLLHYYVHLMEMSSSPETALPMADLLRGLVPDAGHLQHMPTHIDVLCGDWERAIESNSAAIVADEKYVARDGARNFYTLYRCHDYHFKIYAAMFAGKKQVAVETAEGLEAALPEDLLRVPSPPMADWLEGFLAVRVHVYVRFGMWDDIFALEMPKDQTLYCTTTAMVHYAKGIAYANIKAIDKAIEARELFKAALKRVPTSRTLFNNTCVDILAVADAMLDAELDYRSGSVEESFAHFKRAIELSDALPYDEPWGWMQPPRHAYGALLLEHADALAQSSDGSRAQESKRLVADACDVYASDLGFNETLPRALRHPKNIWALHGYVECMDRLERSDTQQAIDAKAQLDEAVAAADVPIVASCACRRKA